MGDANMPVTEGLAAELRHIKEQQLRLETGQHRIENSLGQVIELAKHVALLQERAENHRDETAQLELRFEKQFTAIDKRFDVGQGALSAEVLEREGSARKIHLRVDELRRWVYMVMGGGVVVGALLVYAAESGKTLLAEVVRLHDSELLLKQRVEALELKMKGEGK